MNGSAVARTVRLYPWFRFCNGLLFWQAVWFLYFQQNLSAAEAILLYVVYDISTTVLEVPSGWMSDRIGRRLTLVASAVAGLTGGLLLTLGDSFATLALGQAMLGAGMAFASGTDSALLYESLVADRRAVEIERQELRSWRFGFTALALSAVTGGIMATWLPVLPFAATTVAAAAALAIALAFREPPRTADLPEGSELARLGSLGRAFRDPALTWLFVLSVAMYGFSHVPFVFGQPVILEALAGLGLDGDAPLVSGAISSGMMVLSVGVSLAAPWLRMRLGLARILVLAFAMQVALIGVLAVSDAALIILLLLLRMVPDSLSRPFILARIQPGLTDAARATYLSLQSLAGRLVFAASLAVAAAFTGDRTRMTGDEIAAVLGWYAAGGLILLAGLALAAGRVRLEPARGDRPGGAPAGGQD